MRLLQVALFPLWLIWVLIKALFWAAIGSCCIFVGGIVGEFDPKRLEEKEKERTPAQVKVYEDQDENDRDRQFFIDLKDGRAFAQVNAALDDPENTWEPVRESSEEWEHRKLEAAARNRG